MQCPLLAQRIYESRCLFVNVLTAADPENCRLSVIPGSVWCNNSES